MAFYQRSEDICVTGGFKSAEAIMFSYYAALIAAMPEY